MHPYRVSLDICKLAFQLTVRGKRDALDTNAALRRYRTVPPPWHGITMNFRLDLSRISCPAALAKVHCNYRTVPR
jgi:hypothetical protein